jgi:hypothetical protein
MGIEREEEDLTHKAHTLQNPSKACLRIKKSLELYQDTE